MSIRKDVFLIRASATALFAAALMPAAMAQAQAAGQSSSLDDQQLQEIVVTGTSIRGAAPVGSNLVSVSRDAIEQTNAQTMQQILKTVPAVTGLGSPGQGGFGSSDGSGANAPTIHGLGASASNSTLILINGHRLPLTGINHTVGDPNIVPSVAIERVEVLPDGASSIYGSDAVAGVINFITRKNYDGLQASAQYGYANDYNTFNGNVLWGKGWDSGSVMLAYTYSHRSRLRTVDRDFAYPNHSDQGGTNFASFQCGPATVQPAGSNLIYTYPYNGSSVVNAQANAMCNNIDYSDLLPEETRNSVFASVNQDVGDALSFSADITYSDRHNNSRLSRGGFNATIYGPGSGKGDQINPFFVDPTGTGVSQETVRFNGDNLFGPGAYQDAGARTFMANAQIDYKIADDRFHLTVAGTIGNDDSWQRNNGQLCTSCAYLAVNGTTNGSGNLATPSIPGTTTVILNTPLTPDNAFDVYNPLGSNLTSPAVLAQLTDAATAALAHQSLQNVRANFTGSLFDLPGGALRFALGAEYARYTLHQDIVRPNNTGPASTGSSALYLDYNRNVKSAYAELLVPVVGEDMNVPLVQKLELDLSGRYDKYSDFGSTTNPKVSADWTMVRGVKLRGNYAESFVAPALTSIGSGGGITGESGYAQFGQGVINIPVDRFPGVVGLPGCAAGATTCQIGTSTVTGLLMNGGNANLKPQTGKTWSVGVDFDPVALSGFHAGVTYWTNKLKGGITSPTSALAINSPALNYLYSFYPGGATPAQIASVVGGLPQTGAIPATTYFIYDFRQQNVLNLDVRGIDANASYRFNTEVGRVTVGGSWSHFTKFSQQVGEGSPWFTVLNTVGFNTTFPSIRDQGRFNVNLDADDFSLAAFLNYTGSFRNWGGSTVTPVTHDSAGYPTGAGGDEVASYTTIDLHASYKLPIFTSDKAGGRPEIYVDANNVFNKTPSFYNSSTGFTTFAGNPIGRLVSVGIRTRF